MNKWPFGKSCELPIEHDDFPWLYGYVSSPLHMVIQDDGLVWYMETNYGLVFYGNSNNCWFDGRDGPPQ